MFPLILILIVASAGFSHAINQWMYNYSRKAGIQSKDENTLRWESSPKPTVGGISFYATFLLAAIVYFLTQPHDWGQEHEMYITLGVVTLGFLVGLHDDAYETKPLIKFLGQLSCGLILIGFDLGINLFGVWPVDHFLTLFWVVGIMNSINLLDNMDGVTGMVSLTIVLATILRIVLLDGNAAMNPSLFILIASVGSHLAFLRMNHKPSKIYMGDTGSQFLGALLAVVGIKFFWNFEVGGRALDWHTRAIVPVMIFLVPIMDTTFVTIARTMRGQSPFVGGKDHLTHHMTYLGISDSLVPYVLSLVSIASGLLAVLGLRYLPTWPVVQTSIFVSYIIVIFVIFYLLYRLGERSSKVNQQFAQNLEPGFKEEWQRAEYVAEEAQRHP
ncbi:MAG: putative undecaprenyl-phosphate N-acetylglucosaminyl 1-phosphate transferase [Bacteroidota bacterium]